MKTNNVIPEKSFAQTINIIGKIQITLKTRHS